MKIIIIISSSGVGGSQRVAMHLAEWLNKQEDCSAKIISLKKTQGNQYNMSQYDYEELSFGYTIIGQLRKKIKKFKPDIVLSMGVPMTIYTVPACWFTGVKHIISERNDPAHFAGKALVKYVSRILMRTASGFVFQTKDAQRYYGVTEGKRSTVIPNPLSGIEHMPSQIYNGRRENQIVSVGRLSKQKNQALLIDVFAEIVLVHPEYKLVIWGEGSERKSLEEQIKSMGLKDKVILPGSTDQVFDKIYRASVFVLTSDFEGMPNALMEAMALGIPCISSDCPCGGPRDLIKDGENGMLFSVGNRQELKEKILMIIESDDLQAEISKNAFSIRKTHSLNTVCKKWLDYFKVVCGNGS